MVKDGMDHPTMFEIETALSFCISVTKVDAVLLETGMGGRLDATNIVSRPVCTVIASIGYDHMQYLGNTITEIAGEKAGIIKEGCPVVSYDNDQEANEVIKAAAEAKHCRLDFVNTAGIRILSQSLKGQSFSYRSSHGRWYEKLRSRFWGPIRYTMQRLLWKCWRSLKIITASVSFRQKKDSGILYGEDAWNCCQKIRRFSDGAHNPDGARCLAEFLRNNFTNKRIIYIMGVLADKEYEQMLEETAGIADCIYTVAPDNPRALSSRKLGEAAEKYCETVYIRKRLASCLEEVKEKAGKDDVIVIFGTLSFQKELQGKEMWNDTRK